VALAALCPLLLRDRPAEAGWLAPEERDWLERILDAERDAAGGRHLTFGRAIATPTIVILTLVYTLIAFGVYGKAFFLPLVIKSLGYSDLGVGYITTLPALTGVVGMIVFSRSSDRTGERVWHLIVPCLLGGTGIVLAGLTLGSHPLLAIAAFCLSSFGISGSLPVFWNLPTAFLGAAAAAGGIAFINSVGNVSGYVAPQLVGLLRDATGGYQAPMVMVGVVVLCSGLLVPLAMRRTAKVALT
jgi:ACS family tartrate transporter-like MFS transporter